MMRPPLLPIQLVTPGHSCLQSTDASCGPDCLVNLSFIIVSTQRPQAPQTKNQSTEKDTRTLVTTKSSSDLKSTMTTVKPLILVVGALLLLGKGKGVVALDQAVHGDEELLSGGLEGFKGFEGRQFSSLVGTAPWLQGAGHLLRLFGEGRFDNQPVWPLSL